MKKKNANGFKNTLNFRVKHSQINNRNLLRFHFRIQKKTKTKKNLIKAD